MIGQKKVIRIIKDLEDAGFTVRVKVPGEYPVLVAVMSEEEIEIDTDSGLVEGKASPDVADTFKRALRWCFTDFKETSEKGKIKGQLYGTLGA